MRDKARDTPSTASTRWICLGGPASDMGGRRADASAGSEGCPPIHKPGFLGLRSGMLVCLVHASIMSNSSVF